ncbi:hypothetical protein B0H19DRAFT_1068481 [Mycena capillaripes]|nr:hypothetical protein B0H19DRAFT_1068481 [Mycena capillaripes]
MSGPPTHTLRNPRNPGQGTAFHELIVMHIFTPDLALLYQVPGSNIVINLLAPYGGTVAGSGAVPGSTPENTVDQSTAADDGAYTVMWKSLVYVHVTLEWTEQAARLMHSNARSKKMHESKFPNTDNCTPAQLAHGAAMDKIKAAHSCAEHGTCFIDGNGQYLEMNCFRIGVWGHAVLAGKCRPEDPLPKDLLTAWGGSTSASGSKPRGHTGPFLAQQPASTLLESTNLLLTSMNMASNFSAPAPVATPSAPRSPVQVSSPPPVIEDNLDVFMDAYRCAKNMPNTRIDNAKAQLCNVCYTPNILAESLVTLEQLMELTGFAEGEVHGLKKFERQRTGKIEGKQARCNILY